MTALRSFFYQMLFVPWTLAMGLLYLPLLLLPRRFVVGAARFWLKGNLFFLRLCCGLSCEIRGRENLPKGPLLVAAKHQSAWDTMIFHQLLSDPAYVLKKELLRLPVVGWYQWKSGMIPIDRAAGMKALKFMSEQAQQAVRDGRQVVIFPEGTRTAPGESRPYQSGIALLYQAMGVPVVPVALNSVLFWGRHTVWRRSGVITLEILPPIAPGMDKRAFAGHLAETIEQASLRLQAEAEARFPHLRRAVEKPVEQSPPA